MKCFYWGKNYYWEILEDEIPLLRNFIEEQRSAADNPLTIEDYRFIYEEHLLGLFGAMVFEDWKKVPPRKQARVLNFISRL